VLVQINEPHMYAEDDAVAKIDGYVIAVAGAGPYIGEKRLVRIESVGRTAASGVLADAPANGGPATQSSSAGAGGGGSDDGDEKPKARRRGRRGGRGRSKSGAAEAAEAAAES
jgi:ribonuclease G